jgi:hypothetical protein
MGPQGPMVAYHALLMYEDGFVELGTWGTWKNPIQIRSKFNDLSISYDSPFQSDVTFITNQTM